MVEQPVYKGMMKLLVELESIRGKDASEIPKLLLENFPKAWPNEPTYIEVDSMKLFVLLHIIDRWSNITDLCKAIVNHLDGAAFVMPSLRPRSSFYPDEHLDKDDATQHDVDEYLRGPPPKL